MTTKEKIKTELNELIKFSIEILLYHTDLEVEGTGVEKPQLMESLRLCYNKWYSKCLSLLMKVGKDRLSEFESYYFSQKPIKSLTLDSYTISHFLSGRLLSFRDGYAETKCKDIFVHKFLQQIAIIDSIKERIDSILLEINQILQADLLDSELDAAKELLKHNFLRPAGVICGVVLERHLKSVCENHEVKLLKKNATLNVLNEALKSNNIIDFVKWREISHLGDIRNLCCHDGEREPSKDEINTLIDGTKKTIKSLF